MARANGSPLRDFREKDADTKKRLGRTFAAFIKLPLGAYFVTGGNEPPFLYGNESFKCVCVGNSSLDVSEGEEIIRDIGSEISNMFSGEDLHALVMSTYVSRVMQLNLEDLDSPRGVAAEFIVFDIGDKILRVRYNGNVETDQVGKTKDKVVLVGAYEPAFRRALVEELKKLPTDVTPKNVKARMGDIEKIASGLKKRLRLQHVGVMM